MFTGEEPGRELQPLAIFSPMEIGKPLSNQAMNVEFDPRMMTLTTLVKARAVADCGEAQDWVWTGESFQHARSRTMSECRGVPLDYWAKLQLAQELP
jgi:hypothetical protein